MAGQWSQTRQDKTAIVGRLRRTFFIFSSFLSTCIETNRQSLKSPLRTNPISDPKSSSSFSSLDGILMEMTRSSFGLQGKSKKASSISFNEFFPSFFLEEIIRDRSPWIRKVPFLEVVFQSVDGSTHHLVKAEDGHQIPREKDFPLGKRLLAACHISLGHFLTVAVNKAENERANERRHRH